MAFDVASLVGSGVAKAFSDSFREIASIWKVPADKVLETQTQIETLQLQLQSKLIDQVNAQLDVDKAEAASKSTFVAGARPFILWVCGFTVAWQFLVAPLLTWIVKLRGINVPFPQLDYSTLWPLMTGMLGLGGMHAYERVQGVKQ